MKEVNWANLLICPMTVGPRLLFLEGVDDRSEMCVRVSPQRSSHVLKYQEVSTRTGAVTLTHIDAEAHCGVYALVLDMARCGTYTNCRQGDELIHRRRLHPGQKQTRSRRLHTLSETNSSNGNCAMETFIESSHNPATAALTVGLAPDLKNK
jgi:hypothetical protein